MLNFFCRRKGCLKFTLFYTFFTNNLLQKGYCVPSVEDSVRDRGPEFENFETEEKDDALDGTALG